MQKEKKLSHEKKLSTNIQEFFEKIHEQIINQTEKKINGARREFMTLYVAGMIQSRSVHSKDIASFMDSGVKIDSDIRRIERF